MLQYALILLLFVPSQVWGGVFIGFGAGGSCTSGSERIYPDSHPATTATFSPDGCAANAHHLCVNDVYGSEDGNMLISSYGAHDENSFGLSNTSSMGNDCATSTVVVSLRGIADQGPTYAGAFTVTLNIGGSGRTAAEGAQAFTTSWGYRTFTFTGSWTKAEVDAATVRVQGGDAGSSNGDWVTGISALVNYQ